MNINEDTFCSWAQGPGQAEAARCNNTEIAIRKAIAADAALSMLNITVFAQGSYKARTNIRQDSDVDICVRCNEAVFPEFPAGKTGRDFGVKNSSFDFMDFKRKVEVALRNYFGQTTVSRGNKAFDVHANTYRIDADVVPTLEHQRFTGRFNQNGSPEYHSGVAFKSDGGAYIINWPQQNYDNGVSRNDDVARCYKRVIRILKRLRNKMQEDKINEASNIASFLIECLVWNASLDAFKHDTYTGIVRHVIADVWNRMQKEQDCSEWGEVNELKYLFRPSQPWSREQASQFFNSAWNYIGYK